MTHNTSELKKKIMQKNQTLKSIKCKKSIVKEDVRKVESELDYLLYQYYKKIGCNF